MTADIKKLIPLIALVLWALPTAYSSDYGTIGQSYPIVEEDMMNVIQKNLKKMDIEKMNKDMTKKITKSVENRVGISLPRAKRPRTLEITSIYTLNDDIKSGGKVILKKGTTVNALEYVKLTKMVCFFDAKDDKQVEWTVKNCSDNPANKFVITQGSYADLSKKLKRKIYFDQNGYLTTRLKIQALPAIFRQYGNKLYVQEYLID